MSSELREKFCGEARCLRKIFEPHIYCDKHVDRASTLNLIKEEKLKMLEELLEQVFTQGKTKYVFASAITNLRNKIEEE